MKSLTVIVAAVFLIAPKVGHAGTAAPQTTADWKNLILLEADTYLWNLYTTNADIDANMSQTVWTAEMNALVGAWGGTVNHTAAEYNSQSLFQLKRLVADWKAAGTAPDFITASPTLIAFKTLRDVSNTLSNETAFQQDMHDICIASVQPTNDGSGNQGAQGSLSTLMGQECWPNDPQYGLDANLTNYVNKTWNAWYSLGDTFEPTFKYNVIFLESTFLNAEITGKDSQLSAGAGMFARFRDSVGPAGGMPAYGDSYPMASGGPVGMPYAMAFTQMAHITQDGTYLSAADLTGYLPYGPMSGTNCQYYGYQQLNLNPERIAKWQDILDHLSPLPIVPAATVDHLETSLNPQTPPPKGQKRKDDYAVTLEQLLGPEVVKDRMVIRNGETGWGFPFPMVNLYHDRHQRQSGPGMSSSQCLFPG